MDPTNRGAEEHGQDVGRAPVRRPPRDPLTPDFGQHGLARTVQLVTGDFLLTVNPVDGSEIERCPPGRRPARPVKRAAAERTDLARAAQPPVPPGPALPRLPLLERQEERERLVRLLARGRSVRLTGPAGSGRTALLDAVAEDCADLAPDGVVRLSGYHRTAAELLHDLFAAVYDAPLYRPDRDELLGLVHEIGAVVVLDDLEFGGAALDELLDATPECAYLVSATPDVAAPSSDSLLEEIFLGGLGRAGGLELLERATGRPLTEEEANWAGDLWFESEGLPLRFVQAGALLRQRDRLRAEARDTPGDAPADAPFDAPFGTGDDAEGERDVPLPSLAEGAAPAALLASRLGESARATLRFAVALGGEVPHQAHLPALIGDTHADAALAELLGCSLVAPVGSHYRLSAGVLTQLEAAGYADDAETEALHAAEHYAWWAGHPSVTPERVSAEADAVLAALTLLAPLATAPEEEDAESTAVRLARAAAPAFAAGLHWGAWERALRAGAEASRLAGAVADQAYFHHELGVLALCGGQLDRARAELEASIGLRGALADKRGTVAGRRALALVEDRSGVDLAGLAAAAAGPAALGPAGGSAAGEEVSGARYEESASPGTGVPAPFPALDRPPTVVTRQAPAARPKGVRGLVHGTRRNLAAAGAGALLVAVLGTVVTLGATSNNDDGAPSEKVGVNPSASTDEGDAGLGADSPKNDDSSATSRPADPGEDGVLGTADDPAPSGSAEAEPSDRPSGSKEPEDDEETSKSPSHPTTKPPAGSPSPKPPTSKPSPSEPPSETPTSEPSPSEPSTEEPPPEETPSTSDSAGAPASSPAQSSGSASAPSQSSADPGADESEVI
ncbi:ATP-binding protein [Streptomyces minutiscleroticus]|uniref:ATPase AAA n=1 Tax=Streptomyces minutiscleroticus TaxID=68238 RepID=A0A918KA47_9ACTN|nr:ATP-binding protein [Streptomyces minutiscleroticus]GGX55602.1 ATPase AAA [Streptomyces minutiscleroticus]